MGRPLNKKFFGNAANRILTSAALGDGGGTPEDCSIIEQKSNLKYLVQSESATGIAALTTGIQYRVVALGNSDFTTVGGQNVVGSIFTATGTGAGTGFTAEVYICKLTDSTPNAIGEMTVLVTPENAQTPAEATFTVNRTAGGVIDDAATVITSGGYGYWTGGTFNIGVDTDGGYTPGNEAVVTYTVANGSIVTASVTTVGNGFTASADAALAVDTADIPDEAANPLVQYARIISARTVKTFEGNTFAWPTTGALGQNDRGLGEADLELQP